MKKKEELGRFTVSVEKYLQDFIDEDIIKKGYASRSEFIRDLIREEMVRQEWKGAQEVVGVLTLIYDHHQRELASTMTNLQHSHLLNVMCNLHIHLSHHDCLEIIVIRGKADEIEHITAEIKGLKGVKHAHLSRTMCFEEEGSDDKHCHPH